MMNTINSIFDRFEHMFIIVSYYDHTHSAFLLCSTLCKKTRQQLDDHYQSFRVYMVGNWKTICMNSTSLRLMLPPSDLFKFKFDDEHSSQSHSIKGVQSPLQRFIKNLGAKIGCYFNNHYPNFFSSTPANPGHNPTEIEWPSQYWMNTSWCI